MLDLRQMRSDPNRTLAEMGLTRTAARLFDLSPSIARGLRLRLRDRHNGRQAQDDFFSLLDVKPSCRLRVRPKLAVGNRLYRLPYAHP